MRIKKMVAMTVLLKVSQQGGAVPVENTEFYPDDILKRRLDLKKKRNKGRLSVNVAT